jgi:putative transcriptional regulator
MIKHHPSDTLLTQYCSATLSASLSLAVSIHVDMCPVCQAKVAEVEAANAAQIFNDSVPPASDSNDADIDDDFAADLFAAITADSGVDDPYAVAPVTVNVGQQQYQLPRALTRISHSKFTQIGKIARSRIALDDGPLRSSLLHIGAGGEIPEHTHTGFEITLLLDGEFSDEDGHYVPGDFIYQDASHLHTPVTKEGCLCFTVVSSALHFNKGLSKLLNPIGNLIY